VNCIKLGSFKIYANAKVDREECKKTKSHSQEKHNLSYEIPNSIAQIVHVFHSHGG
jgi:hypothetical protein